MAAPPVAFYAPMKPPDHPVPSGDRLIARMTLKALAGAGFAPRTVSTLRILDMAGDRATQDRLLDAARQEADRLMPELSAERPVAWFTYHSHYKAPDLLGPLVAPMLGLPYLISEPSTSPKRRDGPWGAFAAASDRALAAADRLLWTTPRDRPGLEAAGFGEKLVHLPAFTALGPPVPPRPAANPLRLLAVAMMRPGDKVTSYRRLAAALRHVRAPWQLTVLGDGAARPDIEAAFAGTGSIDFRGAIDDPAKVRAAMEAADILAWPGTGEGVGMVWVEAQAAGLPVVAEDSAAARDCIGGGLLVPPADPSAFAEALVRIAADRAAWSARARAHAEGRHGLDAAASLLRRVIESLAR